MSGREIAIEIGRSARAALTFAAGGGRTILSRQHVPYPFHVTRPFQLDRDRPDIATLYLQSASGGLYRGDDLALDLRVRRHASVHVTTQAGTVVHDTGACPARQRTDMVVEDEGFLAYTPDPHVLFPGAAIANETRIVLSERAKAIVTDGFAWHDPKGTGRGFTSLLQRLTICDATGRCLVTETGLLTGSAFLGSASPLGPYRAAGSMLILGPCATPCDPMALQHACDDKNCLAGVTLLPNGAGWLVRCLARDGGDLRLGLAAVFPLAFHAMTGIQPAPRRK